MRNWQQLATLLVSGGPASELSDSCDLLGESVSPGLDFAADRLLLFTKDRLRLSLSSPLVGDCSRCTFWLPTTKLDSQVAWLNVLRSAKLAACCCCCCFGCSTTTCAAGFPTWPEASELDAFRASACSVNLGIVMLTIMPALWVAIERIDSSSSFLLPSSRWPSPSGKFLAKVVGRWTGWPLSPANEGDDISGLLVMLASLSLSASQSSETVLPGRLQSQAKWLPLLSLLLLLLLLLLSS